MVIVRLLASALALSSPAAPAAAVEIEAAIVRGDDLDLDEIERALKVRLPTLPLARQSGDLPPSAGLRAFIELRRESPTHVQISLILSDGRAYFRAVDTEPDAPARPIAGALALLISAIEEDAVAPDKRDVPVPPALAGPAPITVPPPQPVPEVRCPDTPACPVATAPPQPPPPPAFELAPVVHVDAAFGALAAGGPRGAFGGLGLDLRWLRGALLSFDVRAGGAPVERYRVVRLRATVGAGYGLRRGAFELPIVAMLGVEGWRLAGGPDEAALRGPDARPTPLLGAGLRLSPGLHAAAGPVRVRFGARFELWAAGEPLAGSLRQPLIARPGEHPLAGVGGLELSLGAELAVWISPRKGRRSKVPQAGLRGSR